MSIGSRLAITCRRIAVSGTCGSGLVKAANPSRDTGIIANTVMLAKSLLSSVRSIGGRLSLSFSKAAISSSGRMLSRTSISGGK